jgi:hypothetical protein
MTTGFASLHDRRGNIIAAFRKMRVEMLGFFGTPDCLLRSRVTITNPARETPPGERASRELYGFRTSLSIASNTALESGGILVGNNLTITLEAEFVKA